MKYYTDIEQSKKLVDLGLDPNTADMTWGEELDNITKKLEWKVTVNLNVAIKDNLFSYRKGYVIPCWSVGALMEILPSAIESNGHYYCLKFGKLANETEWYVSYEWEGWTAKIMKGKLMDNAIYDMIIWLLKNNYINTVNKG
jgi:hypothetical protein